jgi:hypothetical protein
MNQQMYLDILTNHFSLFANGQYEDGHWLFHQDNNPKHTSRLFRGFLERERVFWVKFFILRQKLRSFNVERYSYKF